MLELKKGADILSAIGGVHSIDAALALFASKLDVDSRAKIGRIGNEEALLKIANAIAVTEPRAVFVNTGSPEDREAIQRMSLEKGEEQALPMPGHTIHFDLPDEQVVLGLEGHRPEDGRPTNLIRSVAPLRAPNRLTSQC